MGESQRVASWTGVDWVVAGILSVAILRGLWIGLIREAFSILALGGACLVAWLYTEPVGNWIHDSGAVDLSPLVARGISGVVLVVGVIAGVTIVSRMIQKGAAAAGLGAADRLAGGILGAAEGALAAALLLSLGTTVLGADHQLFANSEALRWLEMFRGG